MIGSDHSPVVITGNGNGRRQRRKRRKREENGQTENLSHKSQYVELRKWLKERGFTSKSLIPTHFSDTGRGLKTTQRIMAGEVVISLPEKCLLTTTSVFASYMGEYIKRWKPPISPLLALCTFLISEQHFGARSDWKPYIDILPKSYTCPVFYEDDVVSLLPQGLRRNALDQKDRVLELHTSSSAFFNSLQPLYGQPVDGIFTHDALRWAWCSVNSRTVYMEHSQSPYLSWEPDVYAMAPYLDLLNHCPDVQVKASFSQVSRCYEIRSVGGCRKYQQAFICYGPHDNQRLLLEYGFVAPRNPHSVVYVDPEVLELCFSQKVMQFRQKLLFLKQQDFLTNLTFGLEGPSWRLMTVLRLLSLELEQYSCWRSVLLGSAVSQDREEKSIHLAQILCRHLTEENTRTLEKLSLLKEGAGSSVRDQLAVVQCLRCEEQGILGHSLEVLKGLQG